MATWVASRSAMWLSVERKPLRLKSTTRIPGRYRRTDILIERAVLWVLMRFRMFEW